MNKELMVTTEFNQPESLKALEEELDIGSIDKVSTEGYLKNEISSEGKVNEDDVCKRGR